MKRATRSPDSSLDYMTEAPHGSQEKFRLVSEAVPLFISLLYPDGQIEYVDRHWHEYTGLSWQQTVEGGWASLVHEEDRQAVMDRWRRALAAGQPFELEFRVRRVSDGAERWHSGRCFPIRDLEGRIVRWVAGCVDVHDQRMATQAARESQALFQTLGEAVPAFLWISEANGTPIYQNPTWTAYTGLSQEECSKIGWLALPHPDDLPRIRDLWADANRTGEPMEFEFRCRRHDGAYRWFLARSVPLKDGSGRVARWVGTVTDIHERREAEEELRRSEERFRQMAEAVPSIFWTAAPDGTITYANPQWLDYTGLTLEENARDWARRVLHPDDYERCVAEWQAALESGTPYEIEVRNRGRNGEYRWFVTRATPVKDDRGCVLSWFGVTTDIHELKELQTALREADRRKDEFLATLSHELRNPLSPLQTGLELLRRGGAQDAEKVLAMMKRQVTHLVRLVDDLLEISRITRGKIELRPERLDVADTVKAALETSGPLLEQAGHRVEVNLSSTPLSVRGDPVRLAQILSNLLNNAAKFTPPGGHVWISATREGEHAVLRVRDDGVGIDPQTLDRVFELFAQGSRAEGGLGIGLALAKRIADLHGGQLEARSAGIGQGSEFIVRLPLAPSAPADQDARVVDSRAASLASCRVLVVEDNPDTAEGLRMILQLSGCEVEVRQDGTTALEAVQAFRPSVLLLDLGLPGLDGFEVARQLKQRSELSGLTLIALTGWGHEEHRRLAREAGFDLYLVKPVDPVKLISVIQSLGSP